MRNGINFRVFKAMFSFNEEFWVAVGFIILVALLVRHAKRYITVVLDKKIASITSNLEQVMKIRDDALAMLEKVKQDCLEASSQKDIIMKQAERKVENMLVQARDKAELDTKRDMQSASNLALRNMENMVLVLRNEILEKSIDAASIFLKNEMSDQKKAESLLMEERVSMLQKLKL